jgi:hypothetical protein
MTTAEIELRAPRTGPNAAALTAKIQYAKALADSGLLPEDYRRQPANILWAIDYGEMLGLAPMAAITGVHVIKGKPTASAGLISALVRRAGHKLRVKGDGKSATCQIVRADDPDFTFEVTWTLKRNNDGNPSAEEAGLTGKDTWRNYPAAMLKSRVITQCARDACEEALFGLHYTPEELGAEVDEDGIVIGRDPFRPVPSAEGDAYAAGYRAAEDTAQEIREAEVVSSPEQEWLAAALTAAPNHASLDACAVVWRKSADLVREGKLTKAEAGGLQDVLRKRMEELKAEAEQAAATGEVVDAEIVDDGALDPDDPWAVAIEGLAVPEDAEKMLEDLIDQRGRGNVDPERAARIERAIEARFPQAATEARAA